jgi:hypothetical protein
MQAQHIKMRATIGVEFEAGEGQPNYVLESALMRGVAALAVAIEHGSLTGRSTEIKSGSVITSKEITD